MRSPAIPINADPYLVPMPMEACEEESVYFRRPRETPPTDRSGRRPRRRRDEGRRKKSLLTFHPERRAALRGIQDRSLNAACSADGTGIDGEDEMRSDAGRIRRFIVYGYYPIGIPNKVYLRKNKMSDLISICVELIFVVEVGG